MSKIFRQMAHGNRYCTKCHTIHNPKRHPRQEQIGGTDLGALLSFLLKTMRLKA